MRAELTPRDALEGKTFQSIKERIDNATSSVAVHVRRGDYRHLGHVFTLLGEDYYERAFDALESKLRHSPEYFVFSDEIDWVEQNLRLLSTGDLCKDYGMY